jgi:hypothetical protein
MQAERLTGAQHNQASEGVVESQPACLPLLLPHLLLLSCAPGNQTRHSRPPPPPQLHRTSGVNTVSGTRVQKKPRETMWVHHLRTPKYSTISSSLRSSGSCTRVWGEGRPCVPGGGSRPFDRQRGERQAVETVEEGGGREWRRARGGSCSDASGEAEPACHPPASARCLLRPWTRAGWGRRSSGAAACGRQRRRRAAAGRAHRQEGRTLAGAAGGRQAGG